MGRGPHKSAGELGNQAANASWRALADSFAVIYWRRIVTPMSPLAMGASAVDGAKKRAVCRRASQRQ